MRGVTSIKALGGNLALALVLAAPAGADTLHVTSGADSGNGSLRKAVTDAKASGDTIAIDASVSQIVLESQILLDKSLTIEGQGASATEITMKEFGRFFQVGAGSPVTVRIARLKLAGGRAINGSAGSNGTSPSNGNAGESGGAIFNTTNATLELSETLLTNNATGFGGNGGNSNDSGAPGNGEQGGDGGAIRNSGTLTISNSTISGNIARIGGSPGTTSGSNPGQNGAAGRGGAIFNVSTGKLTISNSTISGNEAAPGNTGPTNGVIGFEGSEGGDGGAIFNEGTLTVANSTLAGNEAGAGGAGEFESAAGGDGAAGGSGGAVFSLKGPVRITNTTFSGNTAGTGGDGGTTSSGFGGGDGGSGGSGGAIAANAASTVVVAATTVSGNAAGGGGKAGSSAAAGIVGAGGAFGGDPTLTVRGSLLVGNTGGNTCASLAMSDGGGNLAFPERANCPSGFAVGDPKLSAAGLANNGGPTQTIALEEGSAAIDLVASGQCLDATGTPLSTDQRGEPRPKGGSCDAGAYEATPPEARVVIPVVPANKPEAGPPIAKIVKQPKKTVRTTKQKTKIAFEFSADVAGATFECKLDRGSFAPCTSPQSYKVKRGSHTFSVRALSSAGAGPVATATVRVKKAQKKLPKKGR